MNLWKIIVEKKWFNNIRVWIMYLSLKLKYMDFNKLFTNTAKLMKKYSWLVIWWDNQINKVISENKKLVIIYWHPLCIPCKKIFPQIIPMYIFYKFKWYNLKFANVKEACEKCVKDNNITYSYYDTL